MAYIELLGTNRGFELGDLSQWTASKSYGSNSYGVSTTNTYEGTYKLESRVYFQKTEEPHVNSSNNKFITGFVPVFAGKNYWYYFWARQYTYTASGGSNTRILRLYLDFYDSSYAAVGSQVTLHNAGTDSTSYLQFGDMYTTPAGASYVKLQIYHGINGWITGSSGNYGLYFDNVSILKQAPAAGGVVYLSDYGVV